MCSVRLARVQSVPALARSPRVACVLATPGGCCDGVPISRALTVGPLGTARQGPTAASLLLGTSCSGTPGAVARAGVGHI